MGLSVWVGSIFFVKLFFLISSIDLTDVLDKDSSTDNAYYTKRISTSITVGNTWSTIREDAEQSLVGSTKTRSIGNRTIECTYHHRQVVRVARIKEEIIATKHHEDVEQNCASRKHVERNTTFLETLEEARSYLETNHEDEENQAEVLHESENCLWTGEANVASQNTCEENEGDA